MIVSLFIGSATQGERSSWVYYMLIESQLFTNYGIMPKGNDSDPELYSLNKCLEDLRLNHGKYIDPEIKIRVHTSYDKEISLPNYDRCNNVHYLQTNADIYAMELAKNI